MRILEWNKARFDEVMQEFRLAPRSARSPARARAITFSPPSFLTRVSSIFKSAEPGPSAEDCARAVDLFDFLLRNYYQTSMTAESLEGDSTLHIGQWAFSIDRMFPGRMCLLAVGPQGKGFLLDPKAGTVETIKLVPMNASSPSHHGPSCSGVRG